ncbi:universal stress protein [Streptomyces cavernicola]|uniref:Universal stress protein n=1 Tax=Streptomyces cavernicola TaxID=3043613 RepID=A0ABT6SNI8_9ACTN|nr:universal stress protein [Streptomyces sp. B-S-A6]MDI3408806.1 universal stress protein [Streptomyces sp. B-S-A6]
MNSDFPAVLPELGPLVVGVDGSPQAHTATLWAADEAARRGHALRLVHAADTDRKALFAPAETIEATRQAGRDLLAETATAVRDRFAGLTVTEELSSLQPMAALRAAAGTRGTIVVGSRGLGGFSALLLGSVGLGVVARSEVPVIVVRGETDRPETGTVTAAVRSAADLKWLFVAAAEAEARKASLRLLGVWNVLRYAGSVVTMLDDLDEIAHARVREVKELGDAVRNAYPGLTVSHGVDTATSVPGALVEASAHTDLLVLGSHRRPLHLGSHLGRIPHAALHHAHCPVEVVPPGFDAGAPGG